MTDCTSLTLWQFIPLLGVVAVAALTAGILWQAVTEDWSKNDD